MRYLIGYSSWKHGDENEFVRIALDIDFDQENTECLFRYLFKELSDLELTYVNGDEYELEMVEFDNIISCEENYALGENKDTQLFPISVRFTIKKDESVKLSEIGNLV